MKQTVNKREHKGRIRSTLDGRRDSRTQVNGRTEQNEPRREATDKSARETEQRRKRESKEEDASKEET